MKKNNIVAVIGSGSWGSAIANLIASKVEEVIMISKNETVINSINKYMQNSLYLPNLNLESNILATDDLEKVRSAEMIFIVIPSQQVRSNLVELKKYGLNKPVIICSKGIENNSLNLMSEIVTQEMPKLDFAIVSGPNLAMEVAMKKPGATSIASNNSDFAKKILYLMESKYFKPYISEDMISMQISATIKNVIAIASGLMIGRSLGENAKAWVITKGIREIVKLSSAKKGKMETMFEVGCIGDIILTCNSINSRNTSLGIEIAKGKKLNEIMDKSINIVEGINAAGASVKLANKLGVKLPLCKIVYEMLNDHISVDEAINQMLS